MVEVEVTVEVVEGGEAGPAHRSGVGGGGSPNLTPRYGSLTRRKPGIIDLTYIYILHKDSERAFPDGEAR